MCGRFVQNFGSAELRRLENLTGEAPKPLSRFNIAPGTAIPVLKKKPSSAADRASASTQLEWDNPMWGHTLAHKSSLLINAKSETAADLPTFARAWRESRVLVPMSGFYEWDRRDGQRQPFYIHPAKDGQAADSLLLAAGLLLALPNSAGPKTCVILTRSADPVVARIHHRMPCFLDAESAMMWLNEVKLLDCSPRLGLYPVSPKVNKPEFDTPECLMPYEPPPIKQLELPI